MMSQDAGVEVVREPERIAVLMEPARRRLMGALAEKPDSAVGLARRLGDKRQRLNYHLGVLEDARLVEVVEERQRRGATERIYRVVARRFVLDPGALGDLAPEVATGDRFSATYLVALAARAIRELARLLDGLRAAPEKRLPTIGVSAEVRLAAPSDFNAFADDLARAVAEVVARYDSPPEGRSFRVVAGSYPAPAPQSDSIPEKEPSDDE